MNIDTSIGGPWTLKSLEITSLSARALKCKVILVDEKGAVHSKSTSASGPVEAAFSAIKKSQK